MHLVKSSSKHSKSQKRCAGAQPPPQIALANKLLFLAGVLLYQLEGKQFGLLTSYKVNMSCNHFLYSARIAFQVDRSPTSRYIRTRNPPYQYEAHQHQHQTL